MAAKKKVPTVRFEWTGDAPVATSKPWADGVNVVLAKGDTIDVPADLVGLYMSNPDFKQVPKTRRPAKKK